LQLPAPKRVIESPARRCPTAQIPTWRVSWRCFSLRLAKTIVGNPAKKSTENYCRKKTFRIKRIMLTANKVSY